MNKFSNDSRRDVDSGMNALLEYLGIDPMNRNQEKEFVSMILSKQRTVWNKHRLQFYLHINIWVIIQVLNGIQNANRVRKTATNNSNSMAKRRYSTYRVRDQTTEFESTKNVIPTVMGIHPYRCLVH